MIKIEENNYIMIQIEAYRNRDMIKIEAKNLGHDPDWSLEIMTPDSLLKQTGLWPKIQQLVSIGDSTKNYGGKRQNK